jgi:hypothetical protein
MLILQLTMQHGERRYGPLWVALPALGGAAAALIVPGVSSTATAGATLLAVGALALLAGHTWGLLVVVPSHLVLVGRLWPVLALYGPGQPEGGSIGTGAVAVVLVTALPALALSAVLLPRIVGHLMGNRSAREQGWVVAGAAALLAAAMVLPAF